MSLGGLSEHDDKPPIFVSSENVFDCLNTCPLLKVDCTKDLVSPLTGPEAELNVCLFSTKNSQLTSLYRALMCRTTNTNTRLKNVYVRRQLAGDTK